MNWSGKNYGVLGDSMSIEGAWQPTATAITGASWVRFPDDCVNGRTLGDAIPAITRDSMASLWALIIFCMTNSWGHQRALGTYTRTGYNSPSNQNTFCRDVEEAIREAIYCNPSTRILFVTPPQRGAIGSEPDWDQPWGPSQVGLDAFVETAQRICADYAVPVVNLFNTSGVNLANSSLRLVDQLHPTDATYCQIGRQIGSAFDVS
jgi:hypothetical protein